MPAYTKEFIAEKIQVDNVWLWKGVLAIYKKQTDTEQVAGMTREHNNVGFNAVDSVILSSFAKQIIRWEAAPANARRFTCPLSPRQLEIAKRKMKKYAGQLAAIANANIPVQATAVGPDDEEAQYNRAHA